VVRGVGRWPRQQVPVQRFLAGRSLSGEPELGRDRATGRPSQLLAVARTCDCLASTAPPATRGGGRPARVLGVCRSHQAVLGEQAQHRGEQQHRSGKTELGRRNQPCDQQLAGSEADRGRRG